MNSEHRAGSFIQQPEGYRAFIPKPLPPEPVVRVDGSKLEAATLSLGRLDSVSSLVPNPDRFVSLYVRQEAVLSSQIEGTQASLAEVLAFETMEHDLGGTSDVREVINCIKALNLGIKRLKTLPVCTRLLCEIHGTLMKEVRGGGAVRTPGELRRSQNWIGGMGPSSAMFVPPPVDAMKKAMGDLEKFLNTSKTIPVLVEVGLAHAQFETIHPFLDGNGRTGRLLITFLLAARGILDKPLLYLSHYFKRHRDEYYARLQAVRTHGDWEGWIDFFLEAVSSVAAEATQRARKIIELRERDRSLLRERLGRRAAAGLDLLDLLIEHPIVDSKWVRNRLRKSQPTVDKLLGDLVRAGVLRETSGLRRGRQYSYARFLTLFR